VTSATGGAAAPSSCCGATLRSSSAFSWRQNDHPMSIQVIVLNGGSSSGKTSLAHALQEILPGVWLRLGVDTLIDASPPSLLGEQGLDLLPSGEVHVAPAFRGVERAWMRGVAAIAGAGVGVIVDDVFLEGLQQQERWRTALAGLEVLWVGVRCSPEAAAARERMRRDRIAGMAASQALAVHRGVAYDVEVDTTAATTAACAARIAAAIGSRVRRSPPA
jgi:chloramphenicol 3-O phosphotransferase